jgi:hypothetical protein
MPKLPMDQFKGLELKPGDKVMLTVASIGNGEVQFEYVDAKDRPISKAVDYIKPVKQPEKPLTDEKEAEKMSAEDMRKRMPVVDEEAEDTKEGEAE